MSSRSTSVFAPHWDLDPELVFLNHGSFGATPRAVMEEQRKWQRQMERNPVGFMEDELPAMLDRARVAVGHHLRCDPDDLALIENATSGVNGVLRSLRFAPGDELLVPDHAYKACRNVLDYVASRSNARVVTVEIPFPIEGPEVVIERVLDAVTDRTALAMLDTVTSPTGLRMPFEPLIEELERRGIQVLLDAAHGIGLLDLHLDDLGASYTVTNAHKWLCAPKGCAILHVRSDRQEDLVPLIISHGRTVPLGDTSRFRHEFDWMGTRDPTAWCTLPFTIEFLGKLHPGGWTGIMSDNHQLAIRARRVIAERLGLEIPCPDSMISALATLILPDRNDSSHLSHDDEDPLHRWLADRGVQVPVWTWPSPAGRYIRVSSHLYNSIEQYAHLADMLVQGLSGELTS